MLSLLHVVAVACCCRGMEGDYWEMPGNIDLNGARMISQTAVAHKPGEPQEGEQSGHMMAKGDMCHHFQRGYVVSRGDHPLFILTD